MRLMMGLIAVLWCCMLPVSLSCSRVLRELAAGRGGAASPTSRGQARARARVLRRPSVDTKRTQQNEAKKKHPK